MRNEIKPNDIVLHKPSGERWVVAGVNAFDGKLIPKGYPFPSIANIKDCELIEGRYEVEYQDEDMIKALMQCGMKSFVDIRSAMMHGLMD